MVGLAHRALQPCQKEKSVWILLASKHVINSSVLSDKLSIGFGNFSLLGSPPTSTMKGSTLRATARTKIPLFC